MRVFITRKIAEEGIRLLTEGGCVITEWLEHRDLTPQELIEACSGHDALLSAGKNRLDRNFFERSQHLKVIALHSVGYDNVDIEAAHQFNIPIGNTPNVLSDATADTAFLLMLAVSRKAFYLHKTIERGQWGFFDPMSNLGISLQGKTLGIFGLGKIGFEMARKCKGAFGMDIIYTNRHKNMRADAELDARLVSFDELLAQSDVISIHAALTLETSNSFERTAFEKMKPTAIFINAARGAIHNQKDLTDALMEGRLWGAGLDVTNPEPMSADDPLLHMPNVAILPHIGSATREARTGMARMAAENILAGLNGMALPYQVLL